MKIAGLDIGTTGCKLTVFDQKGAYLDHAYRDYPVRRSSSEHEVDVRVIMDNVLAVMKEMGETYPDISGIGVTSFGETFVLADEKCMMVRFCPMRRIWRTQKKRSPWPGRQEHPWKRSWAAWENGNREQETQAAGKMIRRFIQIHRKQRNLYRQAGSTHWPAPSGQPMESI